MSTPVPVAAFVRAVRKWLDAVEQGRSHEARFYAEQIKPIGLLLAVDPEFQRLFRARDGDCATEDPEEALRCIHAFVRAATDAALSRKYRSRE